MKIVTIDATKEKEEYDSWVELNKSHGIKPSAPPVEVRLHGKQMQLLGEWISPDYKYAAVREIGAKNTDYHVIDPRFIK